MTTVIGGTAKWMVEAFMIVIEKGKTMTDYIKREDAMKTLADEYDECEFKRYAEGLFKDIPSADVAPVRHGRWIESTTDLICSACETAFNDEIAWMCRDLPYGYPMYCPYCGAKMDDDDK